MVHSRLRILSNDNDGELPTEEFETLPEGNTEDMSPEDISNLEKSQDQWRSPRFIFDENYLGPYVRSRPHLKKNYDNFKKALENADNYFKQNIQVYSRDYCSYCGVSQCNGGRYSSKYRGTKNVDNLVLIQVYEDNKDYFGDARICYVMRGSYRPVASFIRINLKMFEKGADLDIQIQTNWIIKKLFVIMGFDAAMFN